MAMYKLAILDDDQHWCAIAQRFLKQDYAVTIHNSLSSFLHRSDELSQYDILLIDLILPLARYELDIDGVEIVARLKCLPRPPIVILATAYMSKQELEVNGKQMCPQADGFFAKDSGLDLLAQQMKQLLTQTATHLKGTATRWTRQSTNETATHTDCH